MKNRIEARVTAEGSKKTHLKLIPGGIRDIEFVVQCLQLLAGGIHNEVRCTGTLPALKILMNFRALTDGEYTILSEAYTFYRKIENALQWRELLPAFTLPEKGEELEELVSYIHFASGEQNPVSAFLRELEHTLKSVRSVYNDVFSIHETGSFEEMALHAALNPPEDEKVKRFMESLGFQEPRESARILSRLVFGEETRTPESAVHSSVEHFVPKLLKALSDLPDPGGALKGFSRITDSYHARHTLFDSIDANYTFFGLLLSITHGSLFLTDILVGDPSLLDWLVESGKILHPLNAREIQRELKRIGAETKTDELFTRACLDVVNREKLRIGARDITELSDTHTTFQELSKVAEYIVQAAYNRAINVLAGGKFSSNFTFTVLAAGRLGAGLMDFGSDLDLIFVYRATTKNAASIEFPQISIKLAQHILFIVTGGGGANKMYDVDARLRPEGGNSVLAVSYDEYRRYLDHRASEWERLAHIRTRPVAGSKNLSGKIIEALQNFSYGAPFSHAELKKIMDIRTVRIEQTREKYPGLINVKSGAGGLADIDFIAHTYAAHHGSANPSIRRRETQLILKALGSANILKKHDATVLIEFYTFLCDVEKAVRIGSGRAVNTLPASADEVSRVSRLLGFKNTRRFKKRLTDVIDLTAELYDRLMSELLNQAGNGKTQV
ncbi:MAG: hypothetical protein HOC71_13355 [Candidatus Latescibacteria bacterium]|nr:hypothetical protein [Candidatus Latescibacterota bacterium]